MADASASASGMGLANSACDDPLNRVVFLGMNRSQIETALERNKPFTLLMADGKEYQVPHRDYISFPPRGTGAFVIVFDDQGHCWFLSLLTMTGLSFHSEDANASETPSSQTD